MICKTCKHSWFHHVMFDDSLDKYVEINNCEHFSGCDCKKFVEQETENLEIKKKEKDK